MFENYWKNNSLLNPLNLHYLYQDLPQKSKLGFYFHIPFCPHLCPYCDFVKTAKFNKKDSTFFFQRLYDDLDNFLSTMPLDLPLFYPQVTLYFGGGTPSLFTATYYQPIIEKIKRYFVIEEITLESNPIKDLYRYAVDYQKIGVNRLTLGAQSLCAQTLKTLGRSHQPAMVISNIQSIRESGIKEIQVDFIIGLKKEIRQVPLSTQLEMSYDAGATGFSTYVLTIEERTKFRESDLASEDEAAEDYLEVLNFCQRKGIDQLETSNFGQHQSKHNNLYWHGLPYIAFGTGAHGLLPPTLNFPYGQRYHIGTNQREMKQNILGNYQIDFSNPDYFSGTYGVNFEEIRSWNNFKEEMIFLLLRTPQGISQTLREAFWGKDFFLKIEKDLILKNALASGIITLENNSLRLSAYEKIRGDYWTLRFLDL